MAKMYKLRNKSGKVLHANEATVTMLKKDAKKWKEDYTVLEERDEVAVEPGDEVETDEQSTDTQSDPPADDATKAPKAPDAKGKGK